jgi:hypothetical protein
MELSRGGEVRTGVTIVVPSPRISSSHALVRFVPLSDTRTTRVPCLLAATANGCTFETVERHDSQFGDTKT